MTTEPFVCRCVIEDGKWKAVLDRWTCDFCRAMDGVPGILLPHGCEHMKEAITAESIYEELRVLDDDWATEEKMNDGTWMAHWAVGEPGPSVRHWFEDEAEAWRPAPTKAICGFECPDGGTSYIGGVAKTVAPEECPECRALKLIPGGTT